MSWSLNNIHLFDCHPSSLCLVFDQQCHRTLFTTARMKMMKALTSLILALLLELGCLFPSDQAFFLTTTKSAASSSSFSTKTTTKSLTHRVFGATTTTASTILAAGGDLVDSAADEVVEASSLEVPKPVRNFQRAYESFTWHYKSKNNKNEQQQENVRTFNINYRVEGPSDGVPILLVHGFGANINHFRFQFPALVAEGLYRVYAVDLLGFGASDKPADVPYSIEFFCALLQDFCQAMQEQDGIENPWFLAGNSIGGLCCLNLAATTAASLRVQGLVLFNCSGGMTGFRYEDVPYYIRPILYLVQNVMLNPALGGKTFFANFKTRDNVYSILTQQGVYRDTTNVNDELLEMLLGPADDEGAEDVFLRVFGGPPGPTPESLLPHIACPVLAQWGDADPWTPLDAGAHPATQLELYYQGPSWTLDVLPHTGHCPHDERPERVHQVLLPWLKQTLESYTPAFASSVKDTVKHKDEDAAVVENNK